MVHASYLEIYNEDVRDLLSKNIKEKQIRLKLLSKRLDNVKKVCTMYPKNTMFKNSQIIKKMNNEQNLYFINNYKKGQTLCQK